MQVEVNLLGVFLASIGGMLVGAVWYSQGAFGKRWAKLAHVNINRPMSKGRTARIFAAAYAISLITAYLLAYFGYLANFFYRNTFFVDTIMAAFWLWLGFVAVRIWLHNLFEGRKGVLTLLTVGHEFATIIVMAIIVGAFRP